MRKITLLMATLMCGAWCATAQTTEKGYEYVDLGLPSGLKWATCNVGATAPEEYGNYYAWGETEPKTTYDWSTYKWCDGSYNTQTKYCTSGRYGTVDDKTVLELADDAARANWGGAWRMPTDEEWTELRENCEWTWTSDYNGTGVAGRIVTSKTNGNHIFLPAAGYRGSDDLNNAGGNGFYWSSSLYTDGPLNAWGVYFCSANLYGGSLGRFCGRSVRPVLTTYSITLAAENGTVTGAGTYPQGTEVTLTATAAEGYYFVQWSDGTTNKDYTFTLTQDTTLTAEFAANPVYNAVGGVFSVAADKQVQFSAGNLQCTINGTDTAWAFAAHQYDVLGTANVNGSALANTIDLFGWSGSTATAKWGISLSTKDNDYSGDFADWGQNIGDGSTWRTLTNDEWTYLRSTRANASNLMGVARINLDETGTTYANGLILLPDTWTCPEGITFKSGLSSTNSEQAYADYQTFTLEQWAKLEAAGAVFLPASGYRTWSSIYDVQNRGYFWSATLNSPNHASYLYFHSRGIDRIVRNRCFGQAVRLVQDTYTVTATCDAEQGSVSGAGAHPRGKEVTLTATAAEGYYFVQWSDGTTDATYTFTLTQDTTLTAEFAANPVYNTVGGVFSVAADKQVQFSAGNLQYTQSADVWAFAANQYDMVGTANVNGSALANTIDLFGWSGSTATAQWGISTSDSNSDYLGDFVDWGQNIGNGTTWRTLTNDEWTYLRSSRANAANLMGVARINLDAEGTTYANGLILLPDAWTCPEDVTFKSGFTTRESSEQAYADYQTLSLEQWQKLEAAGAVFLPASGARYGLTIYAVQCYGYYRSATFYDPGFPIFMEFDPLGAIWSEDSRSTGYAVRLVQDYSESTKIDDLIINENLGVYAIDGRIVCAVEFRIYDLLGRDVTRENGSLHGIYVVKSDEMAVKVVVK